MLSYIQVNMDYAADSQTKFLALISFYWVALFISQYLMLIIFTGIWTIFKQKCVSELDIWEEKKQKTYDER